MMTRKQFAVLISIAIHLGITFAWPVYRVSAADFDVRQGKSRIELNSAASKLPVQQAVPVRVKFNKVSILKEETEPEAPEDTAISQAPEDGVLWREPGYVANPAPRYPRAALLKQQQGTVHLIVTINGDGKPMEVVIEKSSGVRILDQAARKAIWRWVFSPAQIGEVGVISKSRIPVNFTIH